MTPFRAVMRPARPAVITSLARLARLSSRFQRFPTGSFTQGRPLSVHASKLSFGQPTHETHPHLLKPGELTRGITAQEYHDRRADLMSQLPVNSVAILESATLKYATPAVFYPFHQDLNFLYLTGFQEDNAVAILEKKGNGQEDFTFTLGVTPRDAEKEQWEGARSGLDAARDVFNADFSFKFGDVNHKLAEALEGASQVFTDVPRLDPAGGDGKLWALLRANGVGGRAKMSYPLKRYLDNMRAKKSVAEIKNMRLAGQIGGRAITNLMRREWSSEKDIATTLEYDIKMSGCESMAFIPVVAGGSNGLCVHYVRNDQEIPPGSLIQVDAGGQYGNYVSDISRVWPQSGKFTPAQRDLYLAVLEVQRHCVSLCREDANLSLNELHEIARQKLGQNLRDIGFQFQGRSSDLSFVDELFPHHLGHYVGLDVHDCSGESRSQRLQTGHCVTVEPAIYVPADDRYPKHFWDMGIRIEDCVAVDREGPYVLSTEAVKEIDDIEALRD